MIGKKMEQKRKAAAAVAANINEERKKWTKSNQQIFAKWWCLPFAVAIAFPSRVSDSLTRSLCIFPRLRMIGKQASKTEKKNRKNFMRASCPSRWERMKENTKQYTMFNEFDRSIVRLTATQCLCWHCMHGDRWSCASSVRHGRHCEAINSMLRRPCVPPFGSPCGRKIDN